MIKKIKENKKIRASIFFGFYFFFFLFLVVYIKNNNLIDNSNKNIENKIEEKKEIKEYSIKYLTDNNYKYHYIINDDSKVIEFNGTKETIDYNDYEYKYFLDIYNVNQIIKNSKYLGTENNTLNYDIENKTLCSLTDIEEISGISKISVNVSDNHNLEKVIMDLSTYMKKDKYIITLEYEVGEDND